MGENCLVWPKRNAAGNSAAHAESSASPKRRQGRRSINTAEGVRRIPQDYLNVARVLQLSEWTVMRKILFPAVLPAVLTGVRLSIGIAWLVIVAAEMLTGGLGIGFWIWNEWNNLNVENIIIAIVIIGVVGLLLEQGLMLLARRFSWQEK